LKLHFLFSSRPYTARAIVYDQPGVTRDRMYIRAFWGDTEFMMVDTGGLESLPGNPADAPSVDTIGGFEILPGMVESQVGINALCFSVSNVSTLFC
jgi:GTP-binding protein